MYVHTDKHLRLALLGQLCRRVDLKIPFSKFNNQQYDFDTSDC